MQAVGRTDRMILFHLNALLWRVNVAGGNKTYLVVHVKCLIFSHDFDQVSVLVKVFHKSLQYKNFTEISSVEGEFPETENTACILGKKRT
jgi:hypothetical protein